MLVGIGLVFGALVSVVGTGLHAGELLALQRQAAAFESIAASLKERRCP